MKNNMVYWQLSLLIAFFIIRVQGQELTAKEIARTSLPAVAMIVCDNGYEKIQGSGFFIRPGILITNYHVIENMNRGIVQVAFGPSKERRSFRIARIIAFDKNSDLALLSIPAAKNIGIPSIKLAPRHYEIEVGENVFAMGNPEGLVGTISPGIVSAEVRSTRKGNRIQITAPISHGSSGGPVVNSQGYVIGVAVGSLSEGQNLNFAIPINFVHNLTSKARFPDSSQDYSDTILDKTGSILKPWELPSTNGGGQNPSSDQGMGRGQGNGRGAGLSKMIIGENESGFLITSKPRAVYTDAARQAQVQGTITLSVTFLANGKIGAISVVKGLPNGLDKQAIDAAKKITFLPATKNGVPQTVVRQVTYTFTLY